MDKKTKKIIEVKDINHQSFESLSSTNKLVVLKKTIEKNDKELFNNLIVEFIEPEIFWSIHKILLKEKNYDFLKELINCYKKIENNNDYVNNLLFDFIEKDDLYFVDYLVNLENASTESILENEISVLNECVKSKAFKCFDYFLSKGKNINEFDDLVFYTILEEKKYDFIPLFLNEKFILDENIAKNFFRYGLKNNQENISSTNLNKIIKTCGTLINNNKIIQNKLSIELLKKGNFSELEKNFKKGYSVIGDDNEIMDCAISLEKNSIKFIKLLLDYGGYLTEEQMKKLPLDTEKEIINYPRFSKLNEKLSKNLEIKSKNKLNKI